MALTSGLTDGTREGPLVGESDGRWAGLLRGNMLEELLSGVTGTAEGRIEEENEGGDACGSLGRPVG